MSNKIPTAIEMCLDTVNLGMLIYGSNRINKALKKQNGVAAVLLTTGIVVSVSNTLWIVNKIRKNSEGAKVYDISRANGKSGNSRDDSGNHRTNL
jgi:hypothetical protein